MTAPNRKKTSKNLIKLKEIYLAEYGRHNLFCPQKNDDFYLKYLSEDHVKELLAEKDVAINILELKAQVSLKEFTNQLAEKDKEIERLKDELLAYKQKFGI